MPTRLARCARACASASSKSRARRSLFSSSGTSSASRSAGVCGRGEYLNPKSDANPTSRTSESVCLEVVVRLPARSPTMMSVESVIPGRARAERS